MKEEKKKNNWIVLTILGLAIASGAFGGGILVGKNLAQSSRKNIGQFANMRANGQGQPGGQQRLQNRNGFRPVTGEITSADDKSISVKLQDGSSKIILLSNKTQINKAETATKTDLKIGEKVMIVGQENSDGSIGATNIQLNPIAR